jgi:hypothetical protein
MGSPQATQITFERPRKTRTPARAHEALPIGDVIKAVIKAEIEQLERNTP